MDQRLIDYLADLGALPSSLDDWTIATAQRAGVDVAFVITRGPEIHMLSIAKNSAMSRRNILEHLWPIIEKYGYATTRVPVAVTDHRLRDALGFKQTWADENFTYWALVSEPYTRPSKGEMICL